MGCRARRPQDELVRVVVVDGGRLAVGRSRPGRGAWLCGADVGACFEAAVRRRSLGRALRADLAPDAVGGLRAYLAERARL